MPKARILAKVFLERESVCLVPPVFAQAATCDIIASWVGGETETMDGKSHKKQGVFHHANSK